MYCILSTENILDLNRALLLVSGRPLNWILLRKKCNGTPLQYSCLENPMDGGAWWAAVHGVSKRLTQLSNFTFTFHFHALEKEMATHSSVLAWRIPGMGEPGELPSVGSHRVGHDWNDLVAAARKKWWEWRKGSFLLSLPYSPEELDFKLIECISGTPRAI